MNVANAILSKGADSAVAIVQKGAAVTYGQLRDKVARVAAGLLARRHAKGDRVGILSENSPFFVIAYLGIICAGLVAVPLQTELCENSLADILFNAGIEEVFVSKRNAGRLCNSNRNLDVTFIPEHDLGSFLGEPSTPMPKVDPFRDLAALMFTSGSTGVPKGVMVNHRNIECNAQDIISYMGLTHRDRVMVVLPFHYCFGMSLLHTHLMAGASVVLNNDFKLYPETVLQELQRTECTGLAGVPSTYQILLRKSRFRELDFPQLRWFQQAGGKLPNPCIHQLLSSFSHVRCFIMYGQTEATARLSFLPPERLNDKLGSIGKGLPSTRLEVLDPDGNPVRPGSTETGEIVASGDNITIGYWNDSAETSKFFENGKLYTGDIAKVDADGFIFIVDRERDLIKCGGNRVHAKEVEEVIAEIPEVVEVAVVATPHALLGEAIKAFVVPVIDASITPDHIVTHCRKRLPSFKTPEAVVFLKEMPHNGSGKVLKPVLREMVAS